MAQFSYSTYAANNAAKHNSGDRAEFQYVSSLLANDQDKIIVRFPIHEMDDIAINSTHTLPYPGRQYGIRVRCADENCPICAQGVKLENRYFVKMLVYNTDETVVDETTGVKSYKVVNAIWDRPSAFADIDIKDKYELYGDLTKQLFRLKRNGTGTATRYSLDPIANNEVYNDVTCPADFSGLETIDAARVFSKSIEEYNEGVANGGKPVAKAAPAQPAYTAPAAAPYAAPTPAATPVAPSYAQPAAPYVAPAAPTYAPQPAVAPVPAERKYKF